MTKELREYMGIAEECLAQCRRMIEQEQTKRRALLKRNVRALETSISEQQAGIMQMENLEHRRSVAQEKAGFGDMTARQMLQAMPADDRAACSKVLDALRTAASQLQALNQESLQLARHELEAYRQLGLVADEAQSAVYRPTYKQPRRADHSSFERKI